MDWRTVFDTTAFDRAIMAFELLIALIRLRKVQECFQQIFLVPGLSSAELYTPTAH